MHRAPLSPRRFAALALASALLILPSAVRGQEVDADLLILAVRIDGRYERALLDDVIPTYRAGDRLLVPLSELGRLLELGVHVDPIAGSVTGFAFREEQTLRIVVADGTARVAGESFPLASGDVEARDGDLYFEMELLERLLPLDLTLDLPDMVLVIRPRELLPRELRRLREQGASKELAAADGPIPGYREITPPYALWDVPFADLSLLSRSQPDPLRGRRVETRFSADVASDLLYMESHLFAAGNVEDGVSDLRGSLSRKDPGGRLLGFMGAREIVLGDALSPGLDLIARPRSGPGVLLSNFPLQQPVRFDEHTFEGDVPAGWEIELYRNDALLDYQRAAEDGRYRFDGVPLLFGRNAFRLVFYGPHGERREEQQVFQVGQSLAPAGRLRYRLVSNAPRDGGARTAVEFDYGLNRRLSLNVAAAVVEREGSHPRFVRTGVRGFGGRFSFALDMAVDGDGGRAVKAALQTGLGPLALSLQHARLDRFESEVFEPHFGPIRSRSLARLDGALPLGGGFTIPLSLQWRRDGLASGNGVHHLESRISSFYRGFSMTSELQRVFAEDEGAVETSTNGLLLMSRYGRRFAVRGELAYELEPAREVSGATLSLEGWTGSEYRASLGLVRRFREEATHLVVGAHKMEGNYGFGLTGDYSEAGFAGSMSLTISLSRDSRTGRWAASATPIARTGAVSARVFLDADADGIRDPGEGGLEAAGISAGGVHSETRTGRDGTLLLDGLSVHRPIDLAVSTATLEDPFLLPGTPGFRLIARPGKVAEIDFPVVPTGEVTGTVYIDDGSAPREAGGIRLELIDGAGAVVKDVRTETDGFYDIAGIPVGVYRLRVSPQQLEDLRLLSPPPIPIDILGTDGVIFDGVAIHLTPRRTVRTPRRAPRRGSPGSARRSSPRRPAPRG